MKKFFYLLFFVCFLAVSPCSLTAQNTGNFETNITFQGAPRQLALYVPADYDSTRQYKLLVGLHGLGDNVVNYRNAFTANQSFSTHLTNTIFVFPEAANVNQDYFDGTGGEQVIQASIDYAKQNYNIDGSDILLQGFSLGGRAALRYGLANPTVFKGLLLNTPAIQGVKEGSNKGAYTFNFANASQVPVYITHGGTDLLYGPPIDSVYRNLVLNNGIVKLKRFSTMGHTIPSIPLMDSLKFFDESATVDYDLEILEVMLPSRLCGNKTDGAILVRNTGKQPITSITYEYSWGGPKQPEDWNGTINPNQHAIIPLPFISFAAGSYTFKANVKTLNSSLQDEEPANDTATASILVATPVSLPYTEGFDGPNFPPQQWVMNPSGDVHSAWDINDEIKLTGAASVGAVNTILIFDNLNRKEDLLSPVMDLTSLPSPHLTFDLAYNYHRFTPPYTNGGDVDVADTFEVLVSTNCGSSFTSVFRMGGADLATFPTPIINPITLQEIFINPAPNNWQKMLIPLSAFSSSNAAVICFRYTSALGGSINIDNVSFGNNAVGIDKPGATTVSMYPNPANSQVTVEAGEEILSVEIKDISGKTVYTGTPASHASSLSITTSGFAAGVYLVETATKNSITINKLVVAR